MKAYEHIKPGFGTKFIGSKWRCACVCMCVCMCVCVCTCVCAKYKQGSEVKETQNFMQKPILGWAVFVQKNENNTHIKVRVYDF